MVSVTVGVLAAVDLRIAAMVKLTIVVASVEGKRAAVVKLTVLMAVLEVWINGGGVDDRVSGGVILVWVSVLAAVEVRIVAVVKLTVVVAAVDVRGAAVV